MSLSLGDIAVRFGCELHGDPDLEISGIGTLASAVSGELAFLSDKAYRSQLAGTQATAVLLSADHAEECPVAALVTGNPYLVYARVATELFPPVALRPGIHPGAVASPDASIPASCEIAAGAVVESGVVLGERVLVGPNVVVDAGAEIGDDTRLLAGAVIHHRVRIGARCIIHAGAVVGADGFGNARDGSGAWTKVPQLGRVIVGDDVEIGANSTIDRGAVGDTLIGNGARLDNLVHIAHNLEIGEHTAIAAQSGSAGSTRIGARCMFGGHVGIADHIEIGDDIVVLGGTMVTGALKKPGAYGGPATGAEEVGVWRRNAVRFRQLDDLARRLRQLERAQGKKHASD